MDDATSAEILRARRTTLLAEIARVDGDLADVRAAKTDGTDGTDDDEHDPEGATTSSQWSHATGLRASLGDQVQQVDGALARVAAGTYGTCTRCGRPVGDARLQARPAAAHCIDCARDLSRS